jgi:long-chain acyl-CoA synthetase
MDQEGRVKITDRKKEILVTSLGKNVAPQPIENMLKADKYIEQAVVVGDHRNFITALIVPNFPTLKRWADHHFVHCQSDVELVAHPKVIAKIMSRVERVNAKLSSFEKILKITLLSEEMSPENGLLTASLKVKRRLVNNVYKDLIEKMYGNGHSKSE